MTQTLALAVSTRLFPVEMSASPTACGGLKSAIFLQRCKTVGNLRMTMAEGNFQEEKRKGFESLLLETDVPSYLYEPLYIEDDVKYRE